ncbi:Probable RNA-directed DNA polymerase from transposon BS [Eumeta japonica]|uniref:Probable RNA-directed DNA polymerase from transposon BS n=1 Tax=Eumeta variegata TaxID=151549 RepID=A0A4C1VIV0_EUMVA|nr:Probable RNA-directed DNA polymerase from transposon BS [Eumeta japonica]
MFLVILFNACLRLCQYPTQWKLAQVVMILKPGKQIEEVSSYRPISLLPLIGKLFERVILNKLRPHLDTILPEHQFGFRQKHATIEQIHRLTDTISHTLETKKYCSAVFLDWLLTRSSVPQGSILRPVLYLIFTADFPTDNKTFIATYAYDTAIMSVHEKAAISSSNLQKHITGVEQ